MIGKLNSVQVDEIIKHQIVAHIGCHLDGLTYVVPVSYAYDGESIYVHSREGMKLDMMRKNPKVCIQIDEFFNMANWRSVIAWGNFEELIKKEEREYGLKKLMDRILPFASSETTHLTPHWPFPTNEFDTIEGIVFKIRLTRKTGRFENTAPAAISAS